MQNQTLLLPSVACAVIPVTVGASSLSTIVPVALTTPLLMVNVSSKLRQ
jgi:hypothetical protein